jgi:hypothetical protein
MILSIDGWIKGFSVVLINLVTMFVAGKGKLKMFVRLLLSILETRTTVASWTLENC